MQLTGKVVYINLSGGFWGIEGNDGRQYCPINGLKSPFRQEGLQVKARYRTASAMGISMWGEQVELIDIKSV